MVKKIIPNGIFSYFRIEVLVFIIIIGLFIYFAWKAKKRKYPFLQQPFEQGEVCYRKKKKKVCLSKAEFHTDKILKELFPDNKFKKIRPDWLKSPATGKNLELDLYCESIKTPFGKGLAFEIDGSQHSIYNPHFHKTKHDFTYQVKKDQYKDKVCREKKIVLIRIPYFITSVNLRDYIVKQLKARGVL